jgi:predicted transcriptional regulator
MEMITETNNNSKPIKKGDRLTMKVPFFQTPNSIFDDEHDLSTLDIAVYCYLSRCGNQGSIAMPSLPTIGRKCKMSRSSAAESINSLITHGFLLKKTIPGIGCEYEILYNSEPVQQADGTRPAGGPVTRPAGGPKKELSFKKNYKKDKEGLSLPQLSLQPEEQNQAENQNQQDKTLKAALAYYRNNYELRTDHKPNIPAADVKNLKAAIKGTSINADDICSCLKIMFSDEWYKDKGWPLKTFASQINQFIAKLKTKQENEYSPNVKKALFLVDKYDQETEQVYTYVEPREEFITESKNEPAAEEVQEILTPEQQRLKEMIGRREELKNRIDFWRGFDDSGQLAKIRKYQEEIEKLEKEEAAFNMAEVV